MTRSRANTNSTRWNLPLRRSISDDVIIYHSMIVQSYSTPQPDEVTSIPQSDDSTPQFDVPTPQSDDSTPEFDDSTINTAALHHRSLTVSTSEPFCPLPQASLEQADPDGLNLLLRPSTRMWPTPASQYFVVT
jgi:hypothetical protein